MFPFQGVAHGFQQVTEQFLSMAGGIVGNILQHHDEHSNGGATPTFPEDDDSFTKTNEEQECLDTSQETIDTESLVDIDDGLQWVSLEENGVDKGVVKEAAEQSTTQQQDNPFIVDPMEMAKNERSEVADESRGNEVAASASNRSSNRNGLERNLLLPNGATNENEKHGVSIIKTTNEFSIPETTAENMVLANDENKGGTRKAKHAVSRTKDTEQPAIYTSKLSTLPVPMTTDVSNVHTTSKRSNEISKPTAKLGGTASPQESTTLPPSRKVIDLNADAMATVKLPVTRVATPTVAKTTLVTKGRKTDPTGLGGKRNRQRKRSNRSTRNQKQTAEPKVCDPLAKAETRDFRLRVNALWGKGDGALEWMRRVSHRELYLLGGDRNFLFDLLVFHNVPASISSHEATAVMFAASQRVDLFTEKQRLAITELAEARAEQNEEDSLLQACWQESENQLQPRAIHEDHEAWASSDCHDSSSAAESEATTVHVMDDDVPQISHHITNTFEEKSIYASFAPSKALRLFLSNQQGFLKGNSEDFCHWLWVLGIFTVEDLASAATSNESPAFISYSKPRNAFHCPSFCPPMRRRNKH